MPRNPQIKKVMVIGSGPIIIGQAAEFDYAGTQACRALKEDGIEVVLINSNPATIMTDASMADKIYIEPLTLDTIKRIIEKEKPDSLLSTLGGQTGLTLSMQLAKQGFLDAHNVRLLGANPETIDKSEDRLLFKNTLDEIGEPTIASDVVNDVESAVLLAEKIGYPVVVRPAFTLGGTGGGIVDNEADLREIAENGLRLSPITQVLIEKCISGWKEIEFEVMRDGSDNVITICSMENFDPVGVHTGDSIVVAPTQSLNEKDYNMLRNAALNIISALKVEGGCNCQFALHPETSEYAVIEVNPRVSRSSALASKATGYPIAKVATKIAIGYNLDEIVDPKTGSKYAEKEPVVNYIALKFPKWPFDKFVYAKRDLGTQMKATGEVMSIGHSFEQALMKAVRGAEISHSSCNDKNFKAMSVEELKERVKICDDLRLFAVFEALKKGISKEYIYDITKIDYWFLDKLINLVNIENEMSECKDSIPEELYVRAKNMGYPDKVIEELSGCEVKNHLFASYKIVDTNPNKVEILTPYFYSAYDCADEAKPFIDKNKKDKKTVIVFGSGPIRIGQGIEFDYSCVQCVWALKKEGYDVVIVNNNPETVSTDFDTADRLYFEPLTPEDVMDIIEIEKPIGVVVAFGGQTAIKLTNYLTTHGVNIIGTQAKSIDAAEDREKFDELLESLSIKRPVGVTIMTEQEALDAAHKIGYPVLMRPSYVLGGQNMIIAFNDADIKEYMKIILDTNIENPVLIDKYLMGTELEVDAICDGEDILIPGIMQHVERAGIHSGDSIAVYPSWNLSKDIIDRIIEYSKNLAVGLETKGLVNIQYLVYDNEIYVIEVNPRSSRTIPYITKVTGVPMVELATKASLGEKLADMGYGTGLYKKADYFAVKVPVFSFEKLLDVDTHLGPEMKSTGEVLGVAPTLEEALYKGLLAAGYSLKLGGGVFISTRDSDKEEMVVTAKKYYDLGFDLYATEGTAKAIRDKGMKVEVVHKISENPHSNSITYIESGKIDYIISTSSKGRNPAYDSVKMRRKAVERSIPCLTSIDTANAVADSLKSRFSPYNTETLDITKLDKKHEDTLSFTKMQACGNDYVYFNCFEQEIDDPYSLSSRVSDRHYGVGGDGIVLICPSDVADAKMRIFNLDGSEGKMAGNAIRCVAKYLYDNGIVDKTDITLETLSGIKEVKITLSDKKVKSVMVNMGKAELNPAHIPVKYPGETAIDKQITVGGEEYKITCVSMGNPHAVTFLNEVDELNIEHIGPLFENHEMFPERVNTEFVEIIDEKTLKMRAWERGSGETMACGTGACAAAVAAVLNGYCKKDSDITVKLLGGDLVVKYTDDAVYMTGEAVKVFDGKLVYEH